MSQTNDVLEALRRHGPVCGTDFLRMLIPRYAARINDLRNTGHNIVTEDCDRAWHHHESRQYQYKLLKEGAML